MNEEPVRFDKTGHTVYRGAVSIDPATRGQKTYPGLCYCEMSKDHYPPDDRPGQGKVHAGD